jgi:putative ABC transport system permease protein
MVRSLKDDQRALVELKAVDRTYPLYGELLSNPAQPLAAALEDRDGHFGALAEAALLERLQLRVGDRLQLGETTFILRGVLTREPDRNISAFSLGPRMLVSQEGLAASGLLQPGSLVNYAYRIRLPLREGAEALRVELQTAFPDAGWRLRTWREAAPRVRYFLDRMNLNLTLVGLCALLVGGLGVAGAVRGYLAGKVLHIATFKCLGAPATVIFQAYLLQVLLLGALGSGLGLALRRRPPLAAGLAVRGQMPVPLAPSLFPEVLASAALFGLLTALVFSIKPLGSALRVSPAVLFRGYSLSGSEPPGRRVQLAIALATLALATPGDRHRQRSPTRPLVYRRSAGLLRPVPLCLLGGDSTSRPPPPSLPTVATPGAGQHPPSWCPGSQCHLLPRPGADRFSDHHPGTEQPAHPGRRHPAPKGPGLLHTRSAA